MISFSSTFTLTVVPNVEFKYAWVTFFVSTTLSRVVIHFEKSLILEKSISSVFVELWVNIRVTIVITFVKNRSRLSGVGSIVVGAIVVLLVEVISVVVDVVISSSNSLGISPLVVCLVIQYFRFPFPPIINTPPVPSTMGVIALFISDSSSSVVVSTPSIIIKGPSPD